MIRTNQAIENPIDFVAAHPELIEAMQEGDSFPLLSNDIDVYIFHKGEYCSHASEKNVTGESTNNYLGDLYRQGSASGIQIGSRNIGLRWFPSPKFVNEISEEIGLHPGENVLKFVHTGQVNPYGHIPFASYIDYFAKGEFPQSFANFAMFSHDRGNDHAPGALMLPQSVMASIVSGAQAVQATVQQPRMVFGEHQRRDYADVLDNATSVVTEYSNYLTHSTGDLIDGSNVSATIVAALKSRGGRFHEHMSLASFDNGLIEPDSREIFKLSRSQRNIQRVGLRLYDHLAELKPAIDRVKQERGLVNNTVVREHPGSVGVIGP